MNWTAILALLAVNGFLGFLLRCANDRAELARKDARDSEQRKQSAQLNAFELAQALEKEQRLHRNLLSRQSRSASRKVQHQERGNAAD